MTDKAKYQALAAMRRKCGGPPKKLQPCSHCGQLLGVRERRAHGDKTERARQAAYERARKGRQ